MVHDLLWAALTTAVYGLLRAGEICFKTTHSAILRRSDISWYSDSFIIHLQDSKTDYFRRGVNIQIFFNGSTTCPFTAFRSMWLNAPRRSPDAPAFQEANGTPLRYTTMLQGCRNFLIRLGFHPDEIGTQSCRIGGATTLALLGFPSSTIRDLGRWSSHCYKRYLRLDPTTLRNINLHLASFPSTTPTGLIAPFGRLSLLQARHLSLDNLDLYCRRS